MMGTLSAVPRLIGRSPQADFVLKEDCISRQHARLYLEGDLVHVEDLQSSNGVHVNGTRVHDATVKPSDRIQLGSYTIRVEPVTDMTGTALSHRTELDYADVGPIHAQIVDQDHSSLTFLYRLSQTMAAHRSMRGLLECVLEEVMAAFPAARGFVLTRDEREGAVETCVSTSRRGTDDGPPLSQTLVAHVLHTRNSVLTSDAGADGRFESSDSIVAHQIQAAICVPLAGHETAFGVIYIDGNSSPMPFTHTHLQLLSVVGQMAGSAVENVILTERQIHQERLAAIGQTVSATSHDMRNILTGIAGGIELMEMAQEKQLWERSEKATRILRSSLARFDNLVSSLLTCAKKTELCLEEYCMGPLVREVAEALEPTAAKHGVEIAVDDHLDGRVLMDAHQVHRVLTNLVKNAIEAMEKTGGTIFIALAAQDDGHIVRVRDTGPGISPEHLERMGQAFFTTKEGRGTGLGLAVCYQIMEQHRGKVLVDSAPGAGTTFTLVFPDLSKRTARLPKMTA